MDGVPWTDVSTSDLVVDQIYRSGSTIAEEPLHLMFGVGNAGGFRAKGSIKQDSVRLLVLFSSLRESDWPDRLDPETGTFQYYGDNRTPGRQLHDTSKLGNVFLRDTFARVSDRSSRSTLPPILLFSKTGPARDVTFRVLLVPGASIATPDEQLVAVWRTTEGQRFQNYKALFSVLDAGRIDRSWIDASLAGTPDESLAPPAWRSWVRTGLADRLIAPRTIEIRSKSDQTPQSRADKKLLSIVREHFRSDPHAFEACASEIWKLIAPASDEFIQTRPSRDGGRDAVGTYRIGPESDAIKVDFALEAKCYAPDNSVGVKETSRLISRLRHRNFGVLVTTSYVHATAYAEIRSDDHPVVIVSGADIVATLKAHGRGSESAVRSWLEATYPQAHEDGEGQRADVAYLKSDQSASYSPAPSAASQA